MRRLLALVAVLLSASLAGCSPAAITDPYVLTSNAFSKPLGQVQINMGFSVRSADTSVNVAPEMIRLVIDTSTEKGLLTVALPAEALGISAAEMAQAGMPNGMFELEVLFDGDALYARAPFAAEFLPMLLGSWDEPAEGDFSGWLKLGTVSDFEALMAMMEAMGGGMTSRSVDFSALEGMSPEEMKQAFEGSGITLSYEGSETRNGVEVDHLGITVDYDAFAANPPFEGFDPEMLDQMAAAGLTMTTDMWFERASGRISEVHLTGSSTAATSDSFEATLLFREPDASVSLDAPATFTDVPLFEVLFGFMGGLGDPFGGFPDGDLDFGEDFDVGEDFDFDFGEGIDWEEFADY